MSIQPFYAVSPYLANHVRYFSLFEPRGNEVERVTPEGTIILEIQVDPVKAEKESILILSRFAKPRFVKPNDLGKYFVIAFYPWAVRPFLNRPLSEITDMKISLEDIFGSQIKSLHEKIMNAADVNEMISVAENHLIKKLYNPAKNDLLVAESARHILKAGGNIKIKELAAIYNISRRRLQQRFNEVMGVTPKVYSRVTRFQYALSLMRGNIAKDLTEVAYLSGYSDQAHFIHDFQSHSGTTPRNYLSENLVIDQLNANSPAL